MLFRHALCLDKSSNSVSEPSFREVSEQNHHYITTFLGITWYCKDTITLSYPDSSQTLWAALWGSSRKSLLVTVRWTVMPRPIPPAMTTIWVPSYVHLKVSYQPRSPSSGKPDFTHPCSLVAKSFSDIWPLFSIAPIKINSIWKTAMIAVSIPCIDWKEIGRAPSVLKANSFNLVSVVCPISLEPSMYKEHNNLPRAMERHINGFGRRISGWMRRRTDATTTTADKQV